MGHSFSAIGGLANFTVTPTNSGGKMLFTITDTGNKLTSPKMIRAVLGDAIDQWITANRAQLVTNGVKVGNDVGIDTFGGRNQDRPAGDGYLNFDFNFTDKTAKTPAITLTSLTTSGITVAIPYADVDG